MDSRIPRQPPVAHGEAERWFMRLQMADCSTADRAAFARWRRASPEHAAAYAEVERLFRLAGRAGGEPALRAAARSARERVGQRRRRRRLLLRIVPAAAAVLVLALGIGWLAWNPAEPERRYATAVGERRLLTLDDGSTTLLDTDSALAVRYSRLRRELTLERGRAEFSVSRQPRRPFMVHAGPGTVRALGTRFQVRRQAGRVEVTLVKGAVEVSAPATPGHAARTARLAPGERLAFDADRRWEQGGADLDVARGWTRGQLIFRGRRLADAVEEMNRNNAVQIRLGEPALEDLRISGQFYSDDPDSLVLALEHGWSLRAERPSPRRIELHPRR